MLNLFLFTDQDKIVNLKEKLSKRVPQHCSQIRENQNCSSQIIQTTTTASTATAVTTTTTPSNYGTFTYNFCGYTGWVHRKFLSP